jgi:hypothetical protein
MDPMEAKPTVKFMVLIEPESSAAKAFESCITGTVNGIPCLQCARVGISETGLVTLGDARIRIHGTNPPQWQHRLISIPVSAIAGVLHLTENDPNPIGFSQT